jgi:transposase
LDDGRLPLPGVFLNADPGSGGRDGVHYASLVDTNAGAWERQLAEQSKAAVGSVAPVRSERPRRSWSADEKRRIVQETLEPAASVATVAQRHGINANLLFKWRRMADPGVASAPTSPPVVPAVLRDQWVKPVGRPEGPEFLPIGVFGRAEDEGPALLVPAPPSNGQSSHRAVPARRPSLDERPGVIEVDLPDGARIRVDAFVNEKAFKRVLSVLKSLA